MMFRNNIEIIIKIINSGIQNISFIILFNNHTESIFHPTFHFKFHKTKQNKKEKHNYIIIIIIILIVRVEGEGKVDVRVF